MRRHSSVVLLRLYRKHLDMCNAVDYEQFHICYRKDKRDLDMFVVDDDDF